MATVAIAAGVRHTLFLEAEVQRKNDRIQELERLLDLYRQEGLREPPPLVGGVSVADLPALPPEVQGAIEQIEGEQDRATTRIWRATGFHSPTRTRRPSPRGCSTECGATSLG